MPFGLVNMFQVRQYPLDKWKEGYQCPTPLTLTALPVNNTVANPQNGGDKHSTGKRLINNGSRQQHNHIYTLSLAKGTTTAHRHVKPNLHN